MPSLMTTSQSQLVILSIDSNVLIMSLGQLLDRRIDGLHASRFPHRLGAVVGVASGTVPVSLERFGVEGNLDAPLLGNTDEEEASHPEMVTHRDTLTRADLELPLGGHDLCVDTADVHAGVETCSVVSLDEVTSEDFSSSCRSEQVRSDGSPRKSL